MKQYICLNNYTGEFETSEKEEGAIKIVDGWLDTYEPPPPEDIEVYLIDTDDMLSVKRQVTLEKKS